MTSRSFSNLIGFALYAALASFPGHFLRGGKKRPGTSIHCWRMRAIPMGIRARLHITATFERNLPLYSRILRHVGRWLGMVNELVHGPLKTGR